MTRRPATIAFWRGRLPHWEVEDGRYFVTLHLAGAIPKEGEDRIRQLAAEHDQLSPKDADARLHVERQIYSQMELWLDRSEHVTLLQQPEIAEMISEAISFRHDGIWNVLEYVIMPNHAHLFFELGDDVSLKHSLEQFKRWTGHQAAKILGNKGEAFWQEEWFDHWSRSDAEDLRIMEYMRRNPEKATLVSNYLLLPYGSWRRRLLK